MSKSNDFSYEVVEELGLLSEPSPSGWSLMVNMVSWNGAEPKLDIRSWNEDMSRMAKGVSITLEQAQELYRILGEYLEEE